MSNAFRHSILAVAVAAALAYGGASAQPAPSVALDAAASDIAVDPILDRAYVTEIDTGLLDIVDLASSTLTTRVRAGAGPGPLLANAATGLVYVVDGTDPGTLTVVNGRSGLTVATIPVGRQPTALAADFPRREVYVTNTGSDSLSIVDTTSHAVVADIPTGHSPTGLDISRARDKVYVANAADGSVSVVDQASRSVVATVAVGRAPRSVAVDDRTGHAYVNNVDDQTLSVIDTATDAVVAVLPTGRGSTVGTASSELGRYYLPNAGDGTLTVVDMARNAVIHTFVVGVAPEQVVVDASGGTIMIPDRGIPRITVLDADSDAFLAPAMTAGSPWRAVADPARSGVIALDKRDGADEVALAVAPASKAGTAIATAYRQADDDRYFHSAVLQENRLLADGALGAAWQKTGEYWRVWTAPAPGRFPLCRFHAQPFDPAAAEHYVADTDLCAVAKAEGDRASVVTPAYFVQSPAVDGTCPAGTAPLYRVRATRDVGPSFRYTADASIRDAMLARGWLAEGAGTASVFACTPELRSTSAADARAAAGDAGPAIAAPHGPGMPLLRNQP